MGIAEIVMGVRELRIQGESLLVGRDRFIETAVLLMENSEIVEELRGVVQ
jgi:hypothetical protein